MTLFERTKETAKKQGLTLSSLERKAGLSENALYSWKKSSPKTDNLQKVADVLHVSTDYLLGRITERNTIKENKSVDMDEMLEDDELLMSFQGKEISKEYRDAILAVLRTMPNLDENGKEV